MSRRAFRDPRDDSREARALGIGFGANETDTCAADMHGDAIFWNPHNAAYQCHRCGAAFDERAYGEVDRLTRALAETFERLTLVERELAALAGRLTKTGAGARQAPAPRTTLKGEHGSIYRE